jgi:hypothetical protein
VNFRPAHDTATDSKQSDSYQRLCWQFVSTDDKHDVLETCRELNIKIKTNT